MYFKFLLFDLDHTLLDFDTAEDIALTHFLEEQGVTEIQSYKDYYIPMNKGLWRELEQGKITKLELVNTRFSRLFAHFGIEKDGAELALLYQQHIAQQGQTYAGASELLDSLTAADYEIYGATNGITAIQTGRMAHSDIAPYFNHIFISEKMGTQNADSIVRYKKITYLSQYYYYLSQIQGIDEVNSYLDKKYGDTDNNHMWDQPDVEGTPA